MGIALTGQAERESPYLQKARAIGFNHVGTVLSHTGFSVRPVRSWASMGVKISSAMDEGCIGHFRWAHLAHRAWSHV